MAPRLSPIETTTERSVTGLVQRLEDGYRRIDEAQRNGADTTAWEEFWLKLLREYELLCDELDHAA